MADPATPPADPATPPPGDPATPPATPPADPPPDDGKGGKDAILADLAKERDRRQELEAKVAELTSGQQQTMDAIAKALGLKADDTPPDPAALAAQAQEAQATARQSALQLAVYRNAAGAEANPDLLLDSASFLREVAEVDPADTVAVTAAIKAAVEKNPAFKTTPPTPPFPGGPRKTSTQTDPGPGLPRLRDAYAQSSQ